MISKAFVKQTVLRAVPRTVVVGTVVMGTEKTAQDGKELGAKEGRWPPWGTAAGRERVKVRTALPGVGAQRGPSSSSIPSPKVDPSTKLSAGKSQKL